jgi:hypothetical protein
MLYQWGLADRVRCSEAEKNECKEHIGYLLTLASRAHKDGLLSLEDDIKKMPRGFLRTILQLGSSGSPPQIIREIAEKRLFLSDQNGAALMRRLIELEFVIDAVNDRDPVTMQTKLYGLMDMDPDGLQPQQADSLSECQQS